MAEDLSIKVKVEPDGGGVQGKLDEIAKKNKLKVKAELANESELANKIKNLTSNITAHLEIDPADITKNYQPAEKYPEQCGRKCTAV